MNHSIRVRRRRPRRALAVQTAAAITAAAAIAACGSGSPGSSSSGGRTNPNQAGAQRDTVNFARCMRSHGVPSFPDDLNFANVPGINPSSPAFKTAQTACEPLLPVKSTPSVAPTARAYARLLHWATCMRAHGLSALPDPRPDPPPSGSSIYNTLMGDGAYWVGIPASIDAHSAAFVRLSTACGESPTSKHG